MNWNNYEHHKPTFHYNIFQFNRNFDCNLVKNMISNFQKIFYLTLLSASCSFGQILLSGTSFDPKVDSDTSRAFWGVNDIKYTGIVPGALTIYPPLTPNVNANVFDATFQYGITNNPAKLDATRYQNLPLGSRDNQLVVSPYRGTDYANILSYKVAGLEPGSNVQVRVTYCNAVSANNTSCTAQANSFRGVINPDQYNTKNGYEGIQLQASKCTDFTFTHTMASSNPIGPGGDLTFYLNETMAGNCKAMTVKSLEIWGFPKPIVSVAEGAAVCTTAPIHLSTTVAYEASYKWEVFSGSTWTAIGNTRELIYTPQVPGNLQFRVITNFVAGTLTSTPAIVSVNNCCGNDNSPNTIKTIFHDDFGTLDLSDPTGKTYQVLDYTSNPAEPKLTTKTTTTPFRWPLETAPLHANYKPTGPIMDGEYTVASYLTGYNAYNGHNGAMLQWAGCVHGLSTCPNISYDHSGKAEGAALFLNAPPSTFREIIYTKDLDAGCEGLYISSEVWISVFTNAAAGAYVPAKVKLRLTDVSDMLNISETTATVTRQADGGGAWVRLATNLSLGGSQYRIELINEEPRSENGNDLVVDDIKVRACIPTGSACSVVTKDQDRSLSSATFLYPNPTEGLVYLPDYKQYTSYKILDAQGNVLKSSTVQTEKIDVSDLRQGVYTILLSNDNTQLLRRIVKE